MMHYFHLLWIVPLAAFVGFAVHALCVAGKSELFDPPPSDAAQASKGTAKGDPI